MYNLNANTIINNFTTNKHTNNRATHKHCLRKYRWKLKTKSSWQLRCSTGLLPLSVPVTFRFPFQYWPSTVFPTFSDNFPRHTRFMIIFIVSFNRKEFLWLIKKRGLSYFQEDGILDGLIKMRLLKMEFFLLDHKTLL